MRFTRAGRSAATSAQVADLAAFLTDHGVLELRIGRSAVDEIRLELSDRQFLHLQSLGITTTPEVKLGELAELTVVKASSWQEDYADKFQLKRFLDFRRPNGTIQVHTQDDEQAWVSVEFARPLDIDAIQLRNVGNGAGPRASSLRVSVRRGRRWTVVFDATPLVAQVEQEAVDAAQPISADEAAQLRGVVRDAFSGRYRETQSAFDALSIGAGQKKLVKAVLNQQVLAVRKLEWTIHGPRRSFRYWTGAQKKLYTHLAVTIAEELADLTPNVCFGFGAALCVVRDGEFIPHDDDLDVIIGFEPHEATTLQAGLRRVEDFLRARGYTVNGVYSAHRQVNWGGKAVDVFVGLFEGDTISWYPGPRGGLTRQTMFPPSEGRIYGIPVPLPHDPVTYLEDVYGPGWVNPNPDFRHAWDRSAYADLRRAPKKSK